ncbi:ABC transporter family protein [Babesia ovis]|uniref:ABC transporter family protein n=1 Tax=Babesia ovis TaxID=5869 RepID=A0A9W5WWB8_BABOV|nr:ABC transporter family protein [Babesia ovis]
MEDDTQPPKRPWYSRLMFWSPSLVKDSVANGEFTAEKGYGCYSNSRGLQFLSFSWITPWIGAVAYGDVGHDNYPPLPCSDFDTFASTELGLYLMQSRQLKRSAFFNTVMGNLRLALLRVYKYAFTYLMLLTVLKDAMELFVVCLIRSVVSKVSLSTGSAIASYLGAASMVAAVVTLDAFIEAYHHFYYRRLSLRLEITLHTLLYGKILARDRHVANRRSVDSTDEPLTAVDNYPSHGFASEAAGTEDGPSDEVSILNLALFDVYEVSNGVVRIVDLLNIPVKVLMLSLWLYGEMGGVSIKSLLLLAISTCIMLLCECQCAALLKEYVRRMDLRMFKTQVVLEDLRNLRLVKWTHYAMSSVMGSRINELQLCLKRGYLSALSSWVGMVAPFTMGLCIFIASAKKDSPILKGMNLDKSLAFPLLHALNYFIRPLKRLPSDINDHLETTLSCGRLEEYVCRKVMDIHVPTFYDKFSERVPSSKYEARHPYKVDLHTITSNPDNAVWVTLKKKFVAHLPKYCLPKKEQQEPLESSRTVSAYEIGMEDPNWQFIRSRESIAMGPEMINDSFMGVTYPYVVQFKDATFGWSTFPVISNITLTLCCNQCTLLMGPPGSGKTSLLNAILGELQLLDGSVSVVPWEVNLPIGYVSEDPWISVGTVRECILFGHAMDQVCYSQVVSAAGLDVDFAAWEHGDQRVLDEGGQNLSTGQRMRISLARCLYNQIMHSHNAHSSKYTLYCLDDFFAVLDPALSIQIFKALFGPGGLMLGSSVIMAVQPSFIEMLKSSNAPLSTMDYFVYHLEGNNIPPRHENLDDYMGRLDNNVEIPSPTIEQSEDTEPSITSCRTASSTTQLTDCEQLHGSFGVKNFFWLFNHIGIRAVVVMLILAFTSVSLTIFSDQVVRSWGDLVDKNQCILTADAIVSPGVNSVLPDKPNTVVTSDNGCVAQDQNVAARNNLESPADIEHRLLLNEEYGPFMRKKLNHYYIFTLTNALKIVLCLGICFIEPLGTFQAARTIYSSALGGVLQSPMSVFNNMRIGTVNNRLSTDQTYVDYNVFTRFSHTTATIIYSIMSVVTVCILNWWSGATLPFVLLFTFIVVIRDYLPMCRENMRYILGTRGALCTMISQTMTGASVIRSSKREGAAMSQFLRYLDIHERAKFFHTSAVAWSNVRIRMLSFPLIFVNLLSPILSLLIEPAAECGTALDANVGTALMYSLKLSKSLKALISMLVDISNTMCACQRLQELARLGPRYDPRFERINIRLSHPCKTCGRGIKAPLVRPYRSVTRFTAIRTGVEIVNVTIDYNYTPVVSPEPIPSATNLDNTEEKIADITSQGISVRIDHLAFRPGEHVGIVGRTGSGKSTLLSALAGAVDLASGYITLDGVEIKKFAMDESCDAIGNIPHNPPLLVHWTVRDYVDPRHEWDDLAIWDALFSCSIGSYIRSLSQTSPLDVVLKKSWQNKCHDVATDSDNSVMILDVHLQYLSLARLLLYRRDLRMLLVDESTVVNCSDEHQLCPIPELLNRLFRDCNVFLVAHHAESLRLCDRILVLNNGRLVGQCSPSEIVDQHELATRCSAFASGKNTQ